MTAQNPLYSKKALLLLFIILLNACKKDDFLTEEASLEFSVDEVLFDTVFVSIGSVTKYIKVYNRNDRPVKTNIRLAGQNINFRMNVNGVPGRDFKNVEIRAKDSLWIFVEVTVDPSSATLPFVISDSIVFETNGNQQDINLIAWGQNARFIVANRYPGGLPAYALLDTALHATLTWDSLLPYVIYGYAVVDSTQTLNIGEGSKIHFYNNSGLWIYKGGTLNVNGTVEKPVTFQGTRREGFMSEEPGQWDRIWLNNGAVSTINHAIIKNGFIGLQCDVFPSPAADDKLFLSNSIIRNMSGAGILATSYTIKGWNNIISNCGAYACALTGGGNYDFIHCTIGNYWNYSQRSTPSVYINNYTVDNTSTVTVSPLDRADFSNCIIDGRQDDELEFDFISSPLSVNYMFTNTLIKATETAVNDAAHFNTICHNCNPLFTDAAANDFSLSDGSQALDFGSGLFVIADTTFFDIKGTVRNQSTPDLGAIEK